MADQIATADGSSVSYAVVSTLQQWNRSRGPFRQRVTADGFSFLTAKDRASYRANPTAFGRQINENVAHFNGGHARGFVGPVSDRESFGGSDPQAVLATSAPNDPRRLIQEIKRHFVVPAPNPAHSSLKADFPALLFGTLGNLLVNSSSPRLRATAYAALAYVPGTQVVGNRKDQLGRTGVAISFSLNASRQIPALSSRIIVSPKTGDILEEDSVSTGGAEGQGFPRGTIYQREIFLKSGLVDADSALPGGGTQPYKPLSFPPAKRTTGSRV